MAFSADESGRAKASNVNLYSILGSAVIYKFVQKVVGAEKPRQYCLRRFSAVEPGSRVIDIGSGPGLAVGYLPEVEYIGFEPSQSYVLHARRKYANRAKFVQGYFNSASAQEFKPYDLVLLFGVLHHCDDATVARMLTDISVGLSPRGRVLTVDPCLTATQSAWARRVALSDRGNYVRTPEQYAALAPPHLRVAQSETLDGMLYIPTTVHLAALEHS
jgi:SAM-dependent methyltransferase